MVDLLVYIVALSAKVGVGARRAILRNSTARANFVVSVVQASPAPFSPQSAQFYMVCPGLEGGVGGLQECALKAKVSMVPSDCHGGM